MGTLLSLSKFWTEFWLSMSEWGLLVFGLILSVGLVCEYRLEHNPPPGLKPPSKRRKRLKKVFEMLVIIGVAGEVFSDGGIFGFGSHLQTITERETAAGNERAGNAEKDAGLANERAANAELKVEELRKANDELETKIRPRRITMEQRTNFMALARFIPKIPVKIVIGQEGRDTEVFAKDLRETLTMAGFTANNNAGMLGVDRNPTLLEWDELWNTNSADLIFIEYGTNNFSTVYTPALAQFKNGQNVPMVESDQTDMLKIFGAISYCFQTVGIKTGWMNDSHNVNPGEVVILVPVK